MKYILCLVAVLGVLAMAEEVNIYGAAPGTPPVAAFDSMWQQVNTVALPGGTPHMGIFYDNGTLWHVVNVSGAPFQVYRIDTLGNILQQFTAAGTAYGLGIARAGDSLFIGTFYPSEAVYVFDTAGTFVRQFTLSNGGRCRGVDYDPNTKSLWVFGSPSSVANVNICNHSGTVRKTITISGSYWSFGGCIDWKYYPTRVWYGDQTGNYHNYCQVDTAAGTGSILASYPNPGSSYPEGTGYMPGTGGVGFCWVTSAYTGTAWEMKVHDVKVEEGTNPNLKTETFKISPNPNRNGVVVFSIQTGKKATITVYSATGTKIAALTGRDRIVWNAANQPAGVYFCKLDNATKNLVIVK